MHIEKNDDWNHIEAPGRYADSVTVNGITFLSLAKASEATGARVEDILWWAAGGYLPHFKARNRIYVSESVVRKLATNAAALRNARQDRYGYMG